MLANKWRWRLQVYFSANMQRQAISDAITKGLYQKTRDSQEGVLFRWAGLSCEAQALQPTMLPAAPVWLCVLCNPICCSWALRP